MEPEAQFGNEEDTLGSEIGMRRRSLSFSDDYSVQRTNDDATQCKFTAVQLKYYSDVFLQRFVYGTAEGVIHRDPEISIGYWARISSVKLFIDNFLKKHPDGQIISIGCGFDTLYWRLKSEGKSFKMFVEVDFSSVTARKIRQIRKPGKPNLVETFSEPPKESQHCDLHCGDYCLLGADIRQWNEFKHKLDSSNLDPEAHTLILAECVLVYMSEGQSLELLNNLVKLFKNITFINYEQLNINDNFGSVMQNNLSQRGLQLAGSGACASVDTQKNRFVETGFKYVNVYDMNDMYKKHLDQNERKRVENIEKLDEMELVFQLLAHYCVVYASSEPNSLE